MSKLLITGINGLLGSSLVKTLLSQKDEFVGVDRGPQLNAYLGSYHYVDLDLCAANDVIKFLDEVKPETIIHGAAVTNVDGCETQRELAYDTNVGATATLARWCAIHDAKLIYVSTDYVFDGLGGAPYVESSALKPLGIYARSKAAGEWAVQCFIPQRFVIARTAVPFGDISHVKKDFVRWLVGELKEKRPVSIVTDQCSNPTFAPDLAAMLLQLVDMEFCGIVHTAGDIGLSRFDFAKRCAEWFHLDQGLISPIATSDLKQSSPRPLDARLDVSLAKNLGLKVASLDAALQQLARAGI